MKAIKILLLVVFVVFFPLQTVAKEGKSILSYEMNDEGIYKHWAYKEIENLFYADMVEGFTDRGHGVLVKPDEPITRAQLVKLLMTVLDLSSTGSGQTFLDVEPKEWYSDAIRIASDLGLVEGNSGYFYPNEPITRAEMTKMIVLAFEKTIPFSNEREKVFADVDHENWAAMYIRKASSAGIVNGYGEYFNPNQIATRAEAFVMIDRALWKEQSDLPHDTALTAVLKEYITRENKLVETNRFAERAALNEEFGTGFYHRGGGDPKPFDWFYPAVEEAEIAIEIDDENMEFSVLQKSNRFAKVQVSGISVSVDAKIPSQPELNQNFTTEMNNNLYYLKKDPVSQKWKIYHYQDR